ncbi:MAG: hypothetical protein ACYDB8_01265 [Acidiferrobacterales bacterium]
MNSRTILLAASALGVMVALGVVARAGAVDNDTGSSSNAATPATPYPGQGRRATPAMPGNRRAEEEVERHRPDFDEAHAGRSDVDRLDADRPDVDRPDIDRPHIDRPHIDRPEISRPDIQRPDIETPDTVDR